MKSSPQTIRPTEKYNTQYTMNLHHKQSGVQKNTTPSTQ